MQAKEPDNGGLRIDGALRQRIENFARRRNQSPVDVVRQAFAEFETRHADAASRDFAAGESVYDRMKKLGVIGCCDAPDLPGDLSTNKKYMEGFGCD